MRKNCLLLLIEVLLIFSGCSYRFVNPSEKSVYVDFFSNHTFQPQIEVYLQKNLKKTIAESPVFSLVNNRQNADIVISGVINDFKRNPEFISDSDQVMMASYSVKITLTITKNGEVAHRNLEQLYSLELATNFKMDYLLDMLSKKISQDIYYQLVSDEN